MKTITIKKLNAFGLQEKEEKLDGDAGLNKFFREIFQDADEDARRAMQKSFVSLSQLNSFNAITSTLEYNSNQ